VIGGDDVTLDLAHVTAAFADPNPGAGKTVAISGLSLKGADAGNYDLLGGNVTTTAAILSGTVAEPPLYPLQSFVGYIPGFAQSIDAILSEGSDLIDVVHQPECGQNAPCTGGGDRSAPSGGSATF
jgi:hypothetical protein